MPEDWLKLMKNEAIEDCIGRLNLALEKAKQYEEFKDVSLAIEMAIASAGVAQWGLWNE